MQPTDSYPVKEPEFAGRFYSESETELHHELKQLFAGAKPLMHGSGPLQALISPHAGYVFSGQVAASAFNQILPDAGYKRVFVIASSHRMRFEGASVFTSGNYSTPLGIVKVDLDLTRELSHAGEIFSGNEDAHYFEHSLEVQLPFLQYKLGNGFLLVPVILGTDSPKECRRIAKALEPWFNPENLFVISTDFSHYPGYNDAVKIDEITAGAVISGDPQNLLDTLKTNRALHIVNLATSMCGWASVLTLMYLTRSKQYEYQKIEYLNSGDNRLYGEKDRVVGYHAIAVHTQVKAVFVISEKEKETMLTLARRALKDSYGVEKYDDSDLVLSGILQTKSGVFVSLYLDDKLKGCIGQLESEGPLSEVIKRMAVAASNDRRFESPDVDMLDSLTIEISILSPLRKIESVDEIELGKHGIYIKSAYASGTFLPQVATKTGWTVDEFVGRCSRDKAGLGWDGWKKADLFIYEAVVFCDSPVKPL